MNNLPDWIVAEIAARARNWGVTTVAHRHMEEVARMAWNDAIAASASICENADGYMDINACASRINLLSLPQEEGERK